MATLEEIGVQVNRPEPAPTGPTLESLGIQVQQGQGADTVRRLQPQNFDPRELPDVDPQTGQQLPVDAQGRPMPEAADISEAPNRRRGFSETVEPFLQPAADVAAGAMRLGVNLADLPGRAFNAVSEAAGGTAPFQQLAEQPWVQQFITPSETEGAELRATVGEFAMGGVGANIVAKQIIGSAPSVTYGSDTVMRGILKDISRTGLLREAQLGGVSGAGAFAGGELAGQRGELVGGILAPLAMIRRPRMPFRAEDTAAEILQREADRPLEAAGRVAARGDRPLSAIEKSDDPGLMTLYRSLARNSADLHGDIDEAFVRSQKHLMDELNTVIRPDGTPDPEALSNFLRVNRDGLLQAQDEVIRQATDEMINAAHVTGVTDPVQLSRRFRSSLENLVPDVRQQERALWQISNPDVPMQPLKDSARALVLNSVKTRRLPKKELEEIIGFRIKKGADNWEVTNNRVEGSLRDIEPAEALIVLRSNLMDEIRQQSKGALVRKDTAVLQQLQSASVDTLDQAAVDPAMREAYDTARAFTRRMHEVFDKGLIGRVLSTNPTRGETVLPEQTLKTLFEGGREAQAAAARELTDTVLLESGVRGTTPSQSPLAQSAGEYLLSRFREEATSPDAAKAFMIENQQALRRAPEIRRQLEQAAQQIQQQGQRVASAQTEKELIGKAKFFNLIGQNGKQAVSSVLKEQNPGKAAQALKQQIQSDPDAVASFKNDIADYMLSRATEIARHPDMDQTLAKRGMVRGMNELRPLLSTFYSKDDIRRLRVILDDVSSITAFRSATPRTVEPPRNALVDLAARMIPTIGVAKATRGSSIVLQSFAAGAGRQFADSLTSKQVQKIITRAATDEQLLQTLLKKNLNEKDIARLRQIIPEAGMTLQETGTPLPQQEQQ